MKNNIVLASCDSKYYEMYSDTFCKSLSKLNQTYHLHVVKDNPWNDPSYYACARYLILPEIIEEHGGVFVSDIDVFFFKSVPFPDTKIGLVKTSPKNHRSEWEQRGMHVMAGFFYCQDIDIAVQIRNKINELPKRWFVDQIAIHEVIKHEKSRTYFRKPPTSPEKITSEDFALVPRGKNKVSLKTKFVREQLL
jgi:hypothetical protein